MTSNLMGDLRHHYGKYVIYTDARESSIPFELTKFEQGLKALAEELEETHEPFVMSQVLYKCEHLSFDDFLLHVGDSIELAAKQQIDVWLSTNKFPFKVNCPEADYVVYHTREKLPRVHVMSHYEKHSMPNVDTW